MPGHEPGLEAIEHHHLIAAFGEGAHEVSADKTGTAGHERLHRGTDPLFEELYLRPSNDR